LNILPIHEILNYSSFVYLFIYLMIYLFFVLDFFIIAIHLFTFLYHTFDSIWFDRAKGEDSMR
jgi:maltodextrin utilization protein YvdJ